MNSINWARVMAQIVYYVTGAAAVARRRPGCVRGAERQLRQRPRRLVRPRAWACPSTGSSSARTATTSSPAGSQTGALVAEQVVPTISPAMDIQVSSNLERLLFELLGRDGERTADADDDGSAGLGAVEVPRDPVVRRRAASTTTRRARVIRDVHERHGYVVDPHTAVGIGAAQRVRAAGDVDPDLPMVCLATAHPAKFPDAVEAGHRRPARRCPTRLADLLDRPERYELLPNDLSALQAHIRTAIRH